MPRLSLKVFLVAAAAVAAHLPGQQFTKQASPLGLPFVPHGNIGNGSGLCVADFDADGDMDALVPGPQGTPFFMFRNDGGMQFTDVTSAAGMGTTAQVRCCIAADIDNDGDQDVLVGHNNAFVQLFVNQGGMTFVEQSAARGVINGDDVFGATFGDYDNDGWLDLYFSVRTNSITGSPDANVLLRNTGQGSFVDVTAQAGVGSMRPTLVSVFMDYDEDGWMDLFLAKMLNPFLTMLQRRSQWQKKSQWQHHIICQVQFHAR